MARIETASLNFIPQIGPNYYYEDVRYQRKIAGTLRSVLDPNGNTVHLNTLRVTPELRGHGIGGTLLNNCVMWSKDVKATNILAVSSQRVLPDDSFEHLAKFMVNSGFIQVENFFLLYLE